MKVEETKSVPTEISVHNKFLGTKEEAVYAVALIVGMLLALLLSKVSGVLSALFLFVECFIVGVVIGRYCYLKKNGLYSVIVTVSEKRRLPEELMSTKSIILMLAAGAAFLCFVACVIMHLVVPAGIVLTLSLVIFWVLLWVLCKEDEASPKVKSRTVSYTKREYDQLTAEGKNPKDISLEESEVSSDESRGN